MGHIWLILYTSIITWANIIDTKIEEYKKIWGDIPGLGPDYPTPEELWGDLPGDFDFESVHESTVHHEHDYADAYSSSQEEGILAYREANTHNSIQAMSSQLVEVIMEGQIEEVTVLAGTSNMVVVQHLAELPYFDNMRWNCIDDDTCDVSSFADEIKTYLVVFNRPQGPATYQVELFLDNKRIFEKKYSIVEATCKPDQTKQTTNPPPTTVMPLVMMAANVHNNRTISQHFTTGAPTTTTSENMMTVSAADISQPVMTTTRLNDAVLTSSQSSRTSTSRLPEVATNLCTTYGTYKSRVSQNIDEEHHHPTHCCQNMRVKLADYPRISGNFVRQPNFVNNRAWWRHGGFAIWFDGEAGKQADWVIGLAKNVRAKRYTRAILVSNMASNCPTTIKEWTQVRSKTRLTTSTVRNVVSCRCCSVLTVQGSVYTQNPKYGIYAIDGTYNDRAVYKQAWPSKNNFLYYKNGKYIISDDFGTDIGNKGIQSPLTNEKCPAWSDASWLSWIGVDAWESDDHLHIKCQDEHEECFVSEYFCARFKATGSLNGCVEELSTCETFDRKLCGDQNRALKSACFYGKCN